MTFFNMKVGIYNKPNAPDQSPDKINSLGDWRVIWDVEAVE
jgi:hypothetical protein